MCEVNDGQVPVAGSKQQVGLIQLDLTDSHSYNASYKAASLEEISNASLEFGCGSIPENQSLHPYLKP